MSRRSLSLQVLILSLFAGFAFGGEAIHNWSAPATWSPPRTHGLTALSETPPLPFIAVTPCRAADTRGNGFVGDYGPPSIGAGGTRTMPLTGVCGVAASAAAVSLNVTITDISAAGDVRVFPAGGSAVVSTQNWTAGTGVIANAAAVPLGTGGAVTFTIDGFGAVDLIVDVNGYYASTPATGGNSFNVSNSGLYAIYGQTSSSAINAAAVYGVASSSASSPAGSRRAGVWGDSAGMDYGVGVFGRATASSGYNFGVFGVTTSTTAGTVGVIGEATGTTSGVLFGVEGFTASNDFGAAGVFGVDGSGSPVSLNEFVSSGVRGVSNNGLGVLGVSRFDTGVGGVAGEAVNSSGLQVTAGILGFNSTDGVHAVGNISATGTKPFIEPHPTDAAKEIAYVALEGPEAGTYFRGRGRLHNGTGVIVVPESFRLVSDETGLTVQITPIGSTANVAVLSADLNAVVVRSSVSELEFYYLVNGVRKSFKDWNAITENRHYVPGGPEARMPAAFAPEQRRALIASGIYNPDGTVNMETAERLGWTKMWADREAQAKAAAAANAPMRAATE